MIVKKVSQQDRIRRFVYRLGIFTIILYTIARAHRYYNENYSNNTYFTQPIAPYNKYIDKNGNFLPYFGHKILQLVKKPTSISFNHLHIYLAQDTELKLYFKFVPFNAYHITLTNLKNQTYYSEHHLEILRKEQALLDRLDIDFMCVGKKLIIDKDEIRLEVKMSNSHFTERFNEYQQRWSANFSELITEHYTSFHITLAYQYKDIPTQDTFDHLQHMLNRWQLFPIDIDLDPIEICSYSDLITYTPVVADGF